MENALKITALPKADAVKVLQRAGSKKASEALLEEDIEAGAPVNPDGTVNLIHYAAWLARGEAAEPPALDLGLSTLGREER